MRLFGAKRVAWAALLAFGALAAPSPPSGLVAQTPAPSPGAGQAQNPSRQELLQRIQTQFQGQIARELGLSPAQVRSLQEVFHSYGQARGSLLPRRMELMRRIREMNQGQPTEEQARLLLQELRQLRDEEARLLVDEENRLLEILTPTQVLRLQVLRDEFGDLIRRVDGRELPNFPGARPGGPPARAPSTP